MRHKNIILDTDSYKTSHYLQYPKGTENLHFYLESRGGKFKETLFFGLQYILVEYLTKTVRVDDIREAARIFDGHGVPFNRAGWGKIVSNHEGRLPLEIRAVEEGTISPAGTVLMTCTATNEEFFWLPSYVETLLMRLWYPITVATTSYHARLTIKSFLDKTCDNPDAELPYKLHDFGSRGVSSRESAALGGAAHLVNFSGTDTTVALVLAGKYYGCPCPAAGVSIPAAEHSTITSWGRDNEVEAYRNMLKQFAEFPVIAVVSDSYNIYDACEKMWGGELKEEVESRNGIVVIRPDSGEPTQVVLDCIEILGEKFGYVLNNKGYKVLNNVRVIQGDGLELADIDNILLNLELTGWSAENVAFGMGGGLLQKCNRDTNKFAYKCSAIKRDGVWHDVYKEPVGDTSKRSKRGLLDNSEGLRTVFKDGQLIEDTDMFRIREIAHGK